MPEGPSIVILKEAVQAFRGKKVTTASGNLKTFDLSMIEGKKVLDFKSWGKHFLICFKGFTIRIHFLMFGSYTVNERKDREPRLQLQFKEGEINFYSCAIRLVDGPVDEVYDFSSDVMSEEWDEKKALQKLRKQPETLVCDALLDQNIFSGVGNIIKNEVLFRIRVHPASTIGALPPKKLKELVAEAVNYSFDFLRWKKEYKLRAHWLAHNKTVCPRDEIPFIKEHMGRTNRRTFYCPLCQEIYREDWLY
jgi:endonuclease VIII